MWKIPDTQCPTCRIYHPSLCDCRTALKATIADLIIRIGRPARCICGAAIFNVAVEQKQISRKVGTSGNLHDYECPIEPLPAPAPLCSSCGLPHERGGDCIIALKNAIRNFVIEQGGRGNCSGCGAEVLWCKHSNGKTAPYTVHGFNHFIDCPLRDRFHKRGKYGSRRAR